MTNQQPPPSGGPASKPAGTTGGRSRTVGTGKNGKVTMRDLAGWAKVRHAAMKTLKWAAILGAVGVLVGAIAIYATYKMIDIPDPNTDFQAQTTTVYYSDGKHVLGQFALQNRESVPLGRVPQHVQDAVISAENRSFRTDKGVDPRGIVRAAWNNLRSESTQGASTITQQYVKVLYLSQERTWKRKVKEAFLAVKVQNTLSKDEILEGYLNTIYFGRGAYGIQAAAQAYFDTDAKDLSVAQGAVLAAVLNSPGTLDPGISQKYRKPLLERYRYVLDGMVEMGTLQPRKAARLARHLPKFPKIKQVNRYGGQKGYLMTLVKQQLVRRGFTEEEINGGGLKVVTTFDWKDMSAATHAVSSMRPKARPELHIALASVQPSTGALRAMIGGRNFLQSQFNWALAGGQPGSTFKPFALAAGLKDGFTLRDTFDGNSPYTYPDGTTVRNEGESAGIPDGFDYGANVSLTYATQESINTAFADLTASMTDGPHKVVDAAVAAGIPRHGTTRGLKPNSGVALGSATVSTVEMAEGYATFAAQGRHAGWYVIERVSDASGLQYEHEPGNDRAFSAAVASNVTYALEQVVQQGTGSIAQALRRPAAGKTGTATAEDAGGAEHVSSSWFVGYTPQLATAVMFVRGDGNEPLDGGYLEPFFGGTYPTLTWTAYMKAALAGQPVRQFPKPAVLHGVSPTYSPPPTSYSPPPTYSRPPTTYSPPPTTSAPPRTTSAPPTTRATSPPTTTSAPPTTTAPPTTSPPPTSPPPTTSSPPPTTIPETTPPRTLGSPPTAGGADGE